MTGLLLLFVTALWITFVIWIAVKSTRKIKSGGSQFAGFVLICVVMLPPPVADELVAAPQFRAMCEAGTKLNFDPVTIRGRTIYYAKNPWPFPQFDIVGLNGYYIPVKYRDAVSNEVVLAYNSYSIKGGVLISLLGISETGAPLTFKGSCAPIENKNWKDFLQQNQLTEIEQKEQQK